MFGDFLRSAGIFGRNQDGIRQSALLTVLLLDEIAFGNSIGRKGNIVTIQDGTTIDLFILLCFALLQELSTSTSTSTRKTLWQFAIRSTSSCLYYHSLTESSLPFPSEEGSGFLFRFDSHALYRATVDFLCEDEKAHLYLAYLYVSKLLFDKKACKDRAKANRAPMLDENGKLINKNSVVGTDVFERMRAVELENVTSRLFL